MKKSSALVLGILLLSRRSRSGGAYHAKKEPAVTNGWLLCATAGVRRPGGLWE